MTPYFVRKIAKGGGASFYSISRDGMSLIAHTNQILEQANKNMETTIFFIQQILERIDILSAFIFDTSIFDDSVALASELTFR